MNTDILIPLLITTFVAIFGWYTVHVLPSIRERPNKRRDLVVNYLTSAYRRLEYAAQRDETYTVNIESVIADIQLFGNSEQIKLALEAAINLVKNKGANFNELLENLREELRNEMKLEKIEDKIKYLRIYKGQENTIKD